MPANLPKPTKPFPNNPRFPIRPGLIGPGRFLKESLIKAPPRSGGVREMLLNRCEKLFTKLLTNRDDGINIYT